MGKYVYAPGSMLAPVALVAALAAPAVWGLSTPSPASADDDDAVALAAGHTVEVTIRADEDEKVVTTSAPEGGYLYYEITVTGALPDEEGCTPPDDSVGISYEVCTGDLWYLGNSYEEATLTNGTVRTSRVSAEAGKTIQLHLSTEEQNYRNDTTCTVRAVSVFPKRFETEPNNSLFTANALGIGKSVSGISNNVYEKDVYEEGKSSPTDVWEQDEDYFYHEAAVDGFYHLELGLLEDSRGQSVVEPTVGVYKGGQWDLGAFSSTRPEVIKTLPLTKGERAYVEIVNDFDSPESLYTLKVTRDTVAAPSVRSLASKRKSLKVAWLPSGGEVSGYQVRWSAKKSMKGAKSKTVSGATSGKTTLKGLKAKKRYYVQVRAYYDWDTIGGGWKVERHFFSWATAKSAKTK